MGAGGAVGIGGPDDSWNDGELQEETTHAKRSASDVSAAVEVREWRRIGRGIDSLPEKRMDKYRLRRSVAQHSCHWSRGQLCRRTRGEQPRTSIRRVGMRA